MTRNPISSRITIVGKRLLFVALGLALALCGKHVQAQTLTWNGGGGTLTPSDSSGLWDYTSANWWSGAPGAGWSDYNNAVFGAGAGNGAAGTVTIDATSPLYPNSITFAPTGDGNAYTITGGSIAVDGGGNFSGALPITVNNNATISSQIVGNGGLSVNGIKTLTLMGPSNYSGTTTVSSGTLQMAAASGFPSGIVAHYAFEGNTLDSGPNAQNASFQGGSPTYTTGQFGQAISLSGSQYMTVPYSPALSVTGAYTVSTWINAATLSTSAALVSTRNGGNETFDLQYDGGLLHADIGTGSAWLSTGANYTLPSPAAVGTWDMVTYTVTSTGYTIYVNGVSTASGIYASGTPAFMYAGETLSLGSQEAGGTSYGTGGFFQGAMDDTYLFNSALSQTQITSLFQSQIGSLPGTTLVSLSSGATWNVNGTGQVVSGLAGAGNIALGSGGALTINTAGANTFSGVISDSGSGGSLNIGGAGIQGLAMANTFSGATTVSGGTLQLFNANALQNSTLVPSGGGVVFDSSVVPHTFNVGGLGGTGALALQDNAGSPNPVLLNAGSNGASTTYSGLLTGGGTLNKTGAGTLTLNGSGNSYSATILSGGTVSLASTSPLPAAGNVTFSGGTLQYAIANVNDYSSKIVNSTSPIAINTGGQSVAFTSPLASSNVAGLNKSGAGTLAFSTTNNYAGPTTISGGTVQLGSTSTLIPTSLLQNATLANPNIGTGNFTYYNALSSTQQASLVWTSTGNANNTGGALVNNSGAWAYTTPYPGTGNQAFSLQSTSWLGQSVTLPVGNYEITWSEEGRPAGYLANPLYFEVNGGTQAFFNNTTTGTWTTESATFQVGTSGSYNLSFLGTGSSGNNAEALTNFALYSINTVGPGFLPSTTDVSLTASSAALNLNGVSQTIGSLSGAAGSLVIDSGTLTSGNDSVNATFSGVISGSGAVTKIGATSMFLNGANTYTGPTTISSGTLAIGAGGSLAGTSISVANGGLLSVTGSLATATSLSANGSVLFLSPSQSVAALTDSGSGTGVVSLNSTVLSITGTSTFSGNVNGSGSLKIAGGALTLTGGNGSSVPTTVNSGTLLLSNTSGNNIPSATSVTVNSAGTLNVNGLASGAGLTVASGQTLRGVGTVVGSVTAGAGSTILSGTGNSTGSGIGTLTFANNLTFASGSTLADYLGMAGTGTGSLSGTGGLIKVNGNLTLPASGLGLSALNNGNLGGLGVSGNGYYELFAYSGSLAGFNPSTTFSAPSGKQFTFYNPPGQLDIDISIINFTWTGVNSDGVTVNSSWDSASTNWANGASAAAYQDGGNVIFSDNNAVSGGSVGTSNVVIQAAGVFPNAVTFNNNNVAYTLSDASGTTGIGGAAGITLSGSGTVNLQGANSFTGLVAINSGILNVSNSAGLGSTSGVTVAAGGALQLQGGSNFGAFPLTLAGNGFAGNPAGALNNISGSNSLGGTVTLTAPATIDTSAGQLTLSGPIADAGYGLTIAGNGTTNLTGPGISGSGGLTVGSGATLNLSGSLAGSTLVNNGTLNLNNPLGSTLNLTLLNAGNVSSAGTVSVGLGGTGTVFHTGGVVSVAGTGSVLNIGGAGGSGTYNLSAGSLIAGAGSSVYLGGPSGSGGTAALNLNGGFVQAQGAFTVGNGPTTINLNGGTLQTPAWTAGPNSLSIGFNGGTLQANASAANFLGNSSSASLTVYAGGAVIDTQGNNVVIAAPLTGATGSGVASVSIGRADNTTVFATPPAVTFSGGSGSGAAGYATLNSAGKINGVVITNPGSYSTPPTGAVVANSSVGLNVNAAANSAGGLTKNGAGILALGGVSTYGGPTIINAGTLQLATVPGTASGVPAVAFYSMNGTPGPVAQGAAIADSAGGNTATLAGTGASYIAGKFSQSQGLQLDGSSNYVTVPYSSSLALNAYTVSTWVDITAQPPVTNGSGPPLVSTRNGTAIGDNFDLQYTQPSTGVFDLHADIGTGSSWLTTAANSNTFGALSGWNMITYTVNSTAWTAYLNGVAIGTGATGATPLLMQSGEQLSFGAQQTSTADPYGYEGILNGALENTGIYGSAMTAAQVASLYQSTVGQLPAATPLTIASGASFDLNGGSQQVASLSGLGTVTNSGTGTIATLAIAGASGTSSFGGTIANGAGAVSLLLNGNYSMTEVLTGVNTFTGSASVVGPTLVLANSGALLDATLSGQLPGVIEFDQSVASHSFTLGNLSGPLSIAFADDGGNAIELSIGANNQNATYSGSLNDGGAGSVLKKVGSGTLTLSGSNNVYSGGTFINGGELGLASPAAVPQPGNITFGGGALQFSASNTSDYSASIVNSTGPVAIDTNGQNVTFASPLNSSNSGGFAKLGSGTLVFAAGNAYGGATYLADGTLSLANLAAIPSGSTITFTGGALQYTASNTIDYSSRIQSSSGPIAIDTNGVNVTFASALNSSNSGGLTKIGAGTLVLGAGNSYGGATTVAGGVLQMGVLAAIPANSPLGVSGGILDLNGFSPSFDIASSALSGGTITSIAPSTPVALNLAIVPSTSSELLVGTTLADGGGPLSLTVTSTNGSGLQITSTNAFSGGTTINDSYVRLDGSSALGTGTITVTNSGFTELWWNTGTGTATIANNFVLDTIGGAQFGSQAPHQKTAIFADGAGGGSPLMVLSGSITLTANGGGIDGYGTNNILVTGPITGPGALYKGIVNGGNGGDTVTLSNTADNYQGGTNINTGTLAITADAVLGPVSGSVTFGANSTLQAANNLTIDPNRQIITNAGAATLNAQNFTFTVPGNISGTGGIATTGGASGVVVLSGDNTYGGSTYVNGGTLNLASATAIPSGGTLTFGGGVLQYTAANGGQDYSGQIFNSTGPIAIDTNGLNVNFNNSMGTSNVGGLTKLGPGTLSLGGFNSYTGTTTLGAGTLSLNSPAAISASGAITFAGGTLQYTPNNTVDYSGNIVNSTAPMVIDTNSQNVTYAGVLAASNTAGLTKIGAGTLTVGAFNAYGGPTVVQAGTLQLKTPSPVVSTVAFTTDANSGFSTSNVYNFVDMLNQSSGTSVNGVPVTAVPYPGSAVAATGTGSPGTSWQLSIFAGSTGGGYIAGSAPAAGQVTNTMMTNLFYEGTNESGYGGLTINGLQPGQTYDFRLYYRAYGALDNRIADFTFTDGSAVTTAVVNEDANETGNYINYQYVAGPTGTVLIQEQNDVNMIAGGSWHWYAFSNQLAAGSLLPTSSPLTVAAGATFDLNGQGQQDVSISGAGAVINSNVSTPAMLVVGDATNQNSTFSGTISDAGAAPLSLATGGAGTLTLSGSAAIQGSVSVPMGGLQVTGSLSASVIDISGNGQLSGNGTLATTGGSLDFNSTTPSTFAGSIIGASGLQVDGGSLVLSGSSNFTGGTLVDGSGTLTLMNNEALADGSSLIVGDASDFSSPIISAGQTSAAPAGAAASIAPVPEPGTLLLLLGGGTMLWSIRRRRGIMINRIRKRP